MLKSYYQFLNEDYNDETIFNTDLAEKIISEIRDNSEHQDFSLSGMEFTEPFKFSLNVDIRRNAEFKSSSDAHFKSLPWEKFNFNRDGYVIDANTTVSDNPKVIPSVEIIMVLDPSKEPDLYDKLHARVLDVLIHETNHLTQTGINKNPTGEDKSDQHEREKAKEGYKYFLLKDEMESMIEGFYASSQHQDIPLDNVFKDYLEAFVRSDYISKDEYTDVMHKWITYASEQYPEANFSEEAMAIIRSN